MYHATGGPPWRDSTNWLTDAPISEWIGVQTNEQGRVVRLHLHANRLDGSIPPELGHLTSLSALTLDRNQLSGPIPPELGQLTSMETLFLNGNRLSVRFRRSWAS